MTKDSDGADTHGLIGSAGCALNPILPLSDIGAALKTTSGLVGQAQLAMATIEPLGASYSAGIAAASSSIFDALKPSMAMQSIMDVMRPIQEMQAQFSAAADFRSRVVELTQVGRIAKEMALVQSAIGTSLLAHTKAIRERFSVMEPLRGSSLIAAELAAIATVGSFRNSTKMAELVSMGSTLLQSGQLADVDDFEWDSPASSQLLSTMAAAAITLKEVPESAPDLAGLADASNDDDGGRVSSPQQLQSELAEASTTGDLSRLSPAAKAYFKWFLWLLGAIVSLIAAQNAVREELCFLQPKIWPGMTAGQMGKTVRKAMCESSLVLNGDYRFVKGTDVRLRELPGTKTAILPVHLADGQIIEVLDSSNPDWLHVTVIAENIEGWVSRKYTRVLSLN